MHDLTSRQIQILKSLIEEYIETAEPVGSETLEKKHNLSASPATIRNEMVRLTELGYLKKPHTSAGRIPTAMGMKFYVKQLMKEKELSVAEEVSMKEKVWDFRLQEHRLLREVTKNLASKTGALAFACTEDGEFYCSGYANILEMPEFYDIDITKTLLEVVDEYDLLRSVFSHGENEDEVQILLGADVGPKLPAEYGFVFSHFQTPKSEGEIGVLGPVRLNYTNVVPTVRYFGDLIEEMSKEWR